MLEKLEVNQINESFRGVGEGPRIKINNDGLLLTITYNEPSEKEIKDIKDGDVKVKVCMLKNIVFLLIKFGSQDWMDVSYTYLLGDVCTLEQINDNTSGYALTCILADNTNGMVKVIRYIGLNNKTSKQLKKLLDEQKEKTMTLTEFNHNLNDIYNNYSTKDLLKYAL